MKKRRILVPVLIFCAAVCALFFIGRLRQRPDAQPPAAAGTAAAGTTAVEAETKAAAETAAAGTTAAGTAAEAPFSSGTEESLGGYLPAPPLTWLEGLEIPEWSGRPYTVMNDNVPFFDTEELAPESYEIYYDVDGLGRCTLADAVAGPDLQPQKKRGSIGSVRPTGWHTDRYASVDGETLYNRCHLIAYYLTAENANPRNLVTGTSYMNRQGMNDFENLVGDYIKESGNHVRYRVTPVWTGENLICDGLLVEGWSIEDKGGDICFCIFAHNVQPGIHIDYLTGDNYAESGETAMTTAAKPEKELPTLAEDVTGSYVLNKMSMKFHRPDCAGAVSMSQKNREEYTGSRNALILDGYLPCPDCQP